MHNTLQYMQYVENAIHILQYTIFLIIINPQFICTIYIYIFFFNFIMKPYVRTITQLRYFF